MRVKENPILIFFAVVSCEELDSVKRGEEGGWGGGVSVGNTVVRLDRAKLGVYQVQSFLFIVVIVISIVLKPTFSEISIYGQSFVKILYRCDKDKITFEATGKYWYGL